MTATMPQISSATATKPIDSTRLAFEENIKAISHSADSISIYHGDSLSPDFKRLLDASGRKFRIFSIDGGHSVHHALNDLLVIENYIDYVQNGE